MTKEDLSRYYYLMKEVKQIENKIEEINSIFMRASLINCEKFEKHLSNPQEKRMILIEKYENKLEEAKNRALEEAIKIESYINNITDAETRMIFRYRYIEFKKWSEIAKSMYMSLSLIYLKHKEQLKLN